MPFTPIHFGVGALGKATLGRRFSFSVFAGSQVAMDVEPLVKLLGLLDGPLHGPTHTLVGALLIALVTIVAWEAWQCYGPPPLVERIGRVPRGVIIGTALFGTLTHFGLDSIMHGDMGLTPEMRATFGTGDIPAQWAEIICFVALSLSPVMWLVRREIERLAREGRIPPF
ncbi:hypothetical protein [Azoarcus sp. DN11]|uniref:hypothetical protein n=1 Tax=Azoarcus sp. DN11 TaxID=356837 RepID=UPI000EAF22D9|nr:hypothetical protein [Azoarcus sp. DN11]AYH45777.1 hypothetical protein CDA09_20730 [Azoarcus sp. DN11]